MKSLLFAQKNPNTVHVLYYYGVSVGLGLLSHDVISLTLLAPH
jgi:hypothetical protein